MQLYRTATCSSDSKTDFNQNTELNYGKPDFSEIDYASTFFLRKGFYGIVAFSTENKHSYIYKQSVNGLDKKF